MHETLPPEIQRRLRALHAYMRAMEYGDLESVARLLRAAEQDAALSSMFQEVDLYYQAQEQMLLAEDEQEAFLQADYAEVQQVRLPGVSALSPLAQEGRITAMYSEPEHSLIEQQSLAGPQARTEANTSPRRRSLRFFRTLAAAVVVLVLLGCFLVIYARPGLPGPSTSSTTTGPAQPSGLLFGITATTLLTSNSTTYTAYALHAANKTPSWSTRLSTIKGTGSFQPPVLIRQQALYTVVGNLALALDTKSGHILWQKTLPLDPTGQATLQMDGDLLVAGGQDIHSASFIYRLDEQKGTLLWHYQLGPEPIYAVSHGVVYVGLDQVTSMNTPNPGSLRFLIALKGTNGSVIWQKDHILVTDITVLNGVLYVQNMPVDNVGSDKHYFLDAWTTSGTRLWDIPLSLYRAPVLDSGLLIVSVQTNSNTGATEICAYHPENGHKAWCKPQQFIAYQVQNGVIYLEYT
ncbi:MAG TPA: PQQ-binding-like beta-propeller repeat protein, partial [Ktedonobacteraceae bacterium]|nr:PQQ-binding-like beta-propeller repeat protein [Ktedonobacteraceae bacterium]